MVQGVGIVAAGTTSTGLLLNEKIIDSTMGALAIGFGFSCMLFGILTIQVYMYYRKFRNDTPFIITMVVTIWCLELVDQILIGHSTYHYTVKLWANPVGLLADKAVWSLILQQTFGTLVGTLVKSVFAMRVWRFSSKNWFVTSIISAVIILQFVCGMYYTKRAFEAETLVTSLPKLKLIATLSLTSGCASDVLTAAALAWYLRRLKTGYEESDTLINSLIRYGLGTGFLSGACSLATLILYNVKPTTFEFIASFFVLSKILAISLLSSLNTRKVSKGQSSSQQRTYSRGRTSQMSTTLKLGELHAHSDFSSTSFNQQTFNQQTGIAV